MLNRLLGIKTLEETEPVELEEVSDDLAPTMPPEYDHGIPFGDVTDIYVESSEDGE